MYVCMCVYTPKLFIRNVYGVIICLLVCHICTTPMKEVIGMKLVSSIGVWYNRRRCPGQVIMARPEKIRRKIAKKKMKRPTYSTNTSS